MAENVPSPQTGESAEPNSPGRWLDDSHINDLDPRVRQIFEQYSQLAPERVVPHISAIRQRAYAVYPYPCIAQLRFLQFSIALHPAYPKILACLKQDVSPGSVSGLPSLLDVGCCVGQDLRMLAVDGVPSERLMGLELEQAFIDLGYELFCDRESFKGALLAANVLDDGFASLFEALKARFDVVHAASFFHLFDWDEQVAAAVRIVGLMKSKEGVMVVGRQVGSVKPGHYQGRRPAPVYRHDPASFQRMWDEVGEKTESKWRVNASFAETFGEGVGASIRGDPDARFFIFEVTRIS